VLSPIDESSVNVDQGNGKLMMFDSFRSWESSNRKSFSFSVSATSADVIYPLCFIVLRGSIFVQNRHLAFIVKWDRFLDIVVTGLDSN